jgi:hypothetical protein
MKKTFGFKSISRMNLHTSNSNAVASLVTSNMTLHFDGANPLSNTGSGNIWFNLAGSTNMTLVPSASRTSDGGNSFLVGNLGYAQLQTSTGTGLGVGTGDFTMSIWFKMGNLGVANQLIISQYSSWVSTLDIVLRYITSTKSVACYLGNGIQVNLNSTANTITSTSVWYNISIIRTSGVTKMYLNNQEKASSNAVANIQNFATTMRLGRDSFDGVGAEHMIDNARIGHFSFHNRALSETERTTNFNILKTRFGL